MSEKNIAEGTVENQSVEELQEQLEAEKKAREKAEAKIVDLKKSTKTPDKVEEVNSETTNNFMTRDEFELEQFLTTNSELSEHKEKLQEYKAKGVSLEEAKILILAKDKTIEARQNTQKANFTAGTPDYSKNTYTQEELTSLPQNEYNKVMALREQGKVQIT